MMTSTIASSRTFMPSGMHEGTRSRLGGLPTRCLQIRKKREARGLAHSSRRGTAGMRSAASSQTIFWYRSCSPTKTGDGGSVTSFRGCRRKRRSNPDARAARRRCLLIGRRRHLRTDRRHGKRIGGGGGHGTKCRDRRKQLHQDHQQDDWNKTFQPPTHYLPPIDEALTNTRQNNCRAMKTHSRVNTPLRSNARLNQGTNRSSSNSAVRNILVQCGFLGAGLRLTPTTRI